MKNKPSKNLKIKRDILLFDFYKKSSRSFMEKHTRLIDEFFFESFEQSNTGLKIGISKKPYALIALGGYGRGEQCVHSDVDILILFNKKIPAEAEELVREIIYPLWDIGFEVGHATRTVEECVSLASTNLEVLTSLLDARFICGMSNLFAEMVEMLRNKFIAPNLKKTVKLLIDKNNQRHFRFGNSAYLLEPNLKEGNGGLRDYHTILWIAKVKYQIKIPRDLEYNGYFSQQEFYLLKRALSFIWKVRSCLHMLTNRKNDQLYFEYQSDLTKILKFKSTKTKQPVENFLGILHGHMEFIKYKLHMFLLGISANKKTKKSLKTIKLKKANFIIKNGSLYFNSTNEIVKNPILLIKIFEESVRTKFLLSAESMRIIKEFKYLVNKKFRTDTNIVKSFEYCLLSKNMNIVNIMLNTGFLSKYIPGFRKIINRIQYNEYHIYPVDIHSIKTVQLIKEFELFKNKNNKHLCCEVIKSVSKQKKMLLWAALLHDIGKGEKTDNHSVTGSRLAYKVIIEKGYKISEAKTVAFLVKEHLMLIKIATRRDIYDEATIISCAVKVQNITYLRLLYLLTVADSIATGHKAWNDWTANLLNNLFLEVLRLFETDDCFSKEAVKTAKAKKAKIISFIKEKKLELDIDKYFKMISPRYLFYESLENIIEHINLFKDLNQQNFVWNIKSDKNSDMRTVTVCSINYKGLFLKIAGVLTLNGIKILGTQVYTWKNNTAINVFKVTSPLDKIFEKDKWNKIADDLNSAINGNLDLSFHLRNTISKKRNSKISTLIKPHRIKIDNKISNFFTIVEIVTYDYSGLLFNIANNLLKCEVDIWIAKIAPKVDQVVAVFYVKDFCDQKIKSEIKIKKVKTMIKNALLPTLKQII